MKEEHCEHCGACKEFLHVAKNIINSKVCVNEFLVDETASAALTKESWKDHVEHCGVCYKFLLVEKYLFNGKTCANEFLVDETASTMSFLL